MKFDLLYETKISEDFLTEIMINDVYVNIYTELAAKIPAFKPDLDKNLLEREKIAVRLKNGFFPKNMDLAGAYYYVNHSEGTLQIYPDDAHLPSEINADLSAAGDEAFERLQRDGYEKERALDDVVFAFSRDSPKDSLNRLINDYEKKAGDYYMDAVIFQETILPKGFPLCLYEWTLDFGSRKLRLKKKEMNAREAI